MQLGSDTVSAALRAAGKNDHAKAVLFRVDSPGGSAVASDTIWREVTLLRERASPWWCRWARSPAQVGTTSPVPPT